MPYEFLKDGTPFNAASLTTRFDTLTADVNTITADAIQFLGLGPEQLPSFVGDPTDEASLTSESTSATVTTPSTSGSPLEIDGAVFAGVNSGGYKTYSTMKGFTHQLQNVGSFLSASSTITSLFVLANVEVRKFEDVKVVCGGLDGRVQVWGISLNEYEWDATVILELESNSGIKGYLPRTERQVSPRVTIGALGNNILLDPPEEKTVSGQKYLQGRIAMSPLRDYPGHGTGLDSFGLAEPPLPVVQQFDHRTHQDVSIRTVITRDDLSRLVNDAGNAVTLPDVKHIRFGFASLNNRKYSVQRANITVLPLLAEVK